MNEGCRVWAFFSSPSRHLFLFLIYLSSASEKVQTACLVYQSTICLCFNNYTVSCKITLQTVLWHNWYQILLSDVPVTTLLSSCTRSLHRQVRMAPYCSDAPQLLRQGTLITSEVKPVILFSVCIKCEIPNKSLILTSKRVLQTESQISSTLTEALCSLTAAELTRHGVQWLGARDLRSQT